MYRNSWERRQGIITSSLQMQQTKTFLGWNPKRYKTIMASTLCLRRWCSSIKSLPIHYYLSLSLDPSANSISSTSYRSPAILFCLLIFLKSHRFFFKWALVGEGLFAIQSRGTEKKLPPPLRRHLRRWISMRVLIRRSPEAIPPPLVSVAKPLSVKMQTILI